MSRFVRSSFCSLGDCVEVLPLPDGGVALRTTTAPMLDLRITASEWDAFVQGVKAGEFDPQWPAEDVA